MNFELNPNPYEYITQIEDHLIRRTVMQTRRTLVYSVYLDYLTAIRQDVSDGIKIGNKTSDDFQETFTQKFKNKVYDHMVMVMQEIGMIK